MGIIQKSVTAAASECVVRLDSNSKHSLCGTVYSPYFKKSCSFLSELEFISCISGLLNDLGFPQEAFECRSFFKPRRRRETVRKASETMDEQSFQTDRVSDERATFVVNVQFRQNASWQGNVTWVEKGQTLSFRSVLELLTLMGETQGEHQIVCWNDTQEKETT